MSLPDCRARFGPTGIRLGSRRLAKGFNTDSETGFNALNDWATIVDCGDVLALLNGWTNLSLH
jgi:hypothetical protein